MLKNKLQTALLKQQGVTGAEVSLKPGVVKVSGEISKSDIVEVINKAGFSVDTPL